MAKTLNARIITRNNTAALWTSGNPVLLAGEMGIEKDTRKFKFGDGTTTWNALSYASANPALVNTTAPAVTDSGYDIGVVWVNTVTDLSYILTDNTNGAAIWKPILSTADLTGKEPAITGDVVTKFWSGTKTWRDLATDVRAVVATGLSVATNAVIAATDTILVALGKLQAQITANLTTLTNHTGSTSNPHSVTKTQVGLGSVDNTADATKAVLSATKLTTARTIAATGDATAVATSFDGSANISLAMVLANVITAGTGCKITVDAKGRVTALAPLAAGDIPTLTAAKISDLGAAALLAPGSSVGNVVVVNAQGKIDDSLMPSLAISDVFESATQAAMLGLTAANIGDVCIRSDVNKTFILKAAPYSTLANWIELKTPTDAVISVNGLTGAITLTTSNISEGTNLYWTTARGTTLFNSLFAAKSVTGLTDGANVLLTTDTFILDGGN